jgi:hypothetical protein
MRWSRSDASDSVVGWARGSFMSSDQRHLLDANGSPEALFQNGCTANDP